LRAQRSLGRGRFVASRLAVPRSQHNSTCHTPEQHIGSSIRDVRGWTVPAGVAEPRAENPWRSAWQPLARIHLASPARHAICDRAAAQLDSPLTEPACRLHPESIDPLGLCRTNCPLFVFDSNGVISLGSLLVWTGPIRTSPLPRPSAGYQPRMLRQLPKPTPPPRRLSHSANRPRIRRMPSALPYLFYAECADSAKY